MIKLINSDCLKAMDRLIQKNVIVDAIITDPPNGITQCKWDSIIPFDAMWVRLDRLIKPNGAIIIFGNEPFSSALRMSNIKNYKYDWVWNKKRPSNPMLAKKQVLKVHELISIFYLKQCQYNPQGVFKTDGKPRGGVNPSKTELGFGAKKGTIYKQTHSGYPKSIIEFGSNNIKNVHPTQKPVALLEYLIKTYTLEHEIVLDFTMGSGSTGVACKNTNRQFIGIESDKEYFKTAQKRLKKSYSKN